MAGRGRGLLGSLFKPKKAPESDAERYARIVAQMDKRFARSHKANVSSQSPGAIDQVEQTPGGALIHSEHASLSVLFFAPNLVEIRLRPDRQFAPPFSYAISESFARAPQKAKVIEDSATVLVGAGAMACIFSRLDANLRVVMPNGQEVSLNGDGGFAWRDEEVLWTRQLPQEEWCYGLGQRASGFNLRGQRLALWNFDNVHYQRGTDPVYYSIPFYFGLHPGYTLGVLWDNPARGAVDLGAATSNQMTFSAETGELRFYLIADEKPEGVLKRYLELTGAPPLLPLWAFGYHQSRWSYAPAQRFRELAAEFRQRRIPCDALHFDIDYMDGFRVFTWNKETFGDLPDLIAELGRQGFKAVSIVDPAIKADPDNETYRSGEQVGAFHVYPDGTPYRAPVWAGESAFPDFTNPVARDWWTTQVKKLLRVGFAGLWNDMNEPTVFLPGGAGVMPDYIPAHWQGERQGNTHRDGAHNVYGMLMSQATRQGMEQTRPNVRPFVLTRAAYAGAQRYTGSWTGDNSATWDHLRLTISMVLNLGLAGMFFSGPDIGGFFCEQEGQPRDGELYGRWIQLASLLPFCRSHAAMGTPDNEPWSYGPEVEQIARRALELRYQLLPYLYSAFALSNTTGIPPVHPTFFEDPTDPRLYSQDDAFMVGDVLLVAPVLEKGATSREVYLPRGVWYNFWTRMLIDGARSLEVEAPLDQMPIFVRAGKVLPMWPVMQYVGETRVEELRLRAHAGSGETTFYEDAGEGLEYQHGDYRWLYFTCRYLPNGQFAIDWRRAGAYQPPYQKVRLEVIGISAEPDSVLVDGQKAALWFYERGVLEILTAPFQTVRIIGKAGEEWAAAKTVVRRPAGTSES